MSQKGVGVLLVVSAVVLWIGLAMMVANARERQTQLILRGMAVTAFAEEPSKLPFLLPLGMIGAGVMLWIAGSGRRTCPACGESVREIATVCRYCRSPLSSETTTAVVREP